MDFQLPIRKDTDLYPSPIAPVPFTFIRGGEADRAAALAIIHQHTSVINHFVARNRRNYSLGGPPVFKQMRTVPGLIMTYMNQFGIEKLILEPSPTFIPVEEQQKPYHEDIMLDGYIYIYLVYPGTSISLHPELFQPTAIVYLNNQFVCSKGRDIYPKTPMGNIYGPGHNNDILITFGGDALHAHSWNDDNNEFEKKLLPLPQPGPLEDKHKNKLKPFYYPYGFLDPYNFILPHTPTVFLDEDIDPVSLDPLSFNVPPQYPKPQIVVRKEYEHIKDSPLNPLGFNELQIAVGAMPRVFGGLSQVLAPYVGSIYCEFFSREPKDYRRVRQSWHYIDHSGQLSIIVNDRPKQWRGSFRDLLPAVFAPNTIILDYDEYVGAGTLGPDEIPVVPPGRITGLDVKVDNFGRASLPDGTIFDGWPFHPATVFNFDLSPKNVDPRFAGQDCLPPPKNQ